MSFLNPKYRWEKQPIGKRPGTDFQLGFTCTSTEKDHVRITTVGEQKHVEPLFLFFFRIKNASRNKNDDSLQEKRAELAAVV